MIKQILEIRAEQIKTFDYYFTAGIEGVVFVMVHTTVHVILKL